MQAALQAVQEKCRRSAGSAASEVSSWLYVLWLYVLWLYVLWLYVLWLYLLWLHLLWLHLLWLYVQQLGQPATLLACNPAWTGPATLFGQGLQPYVPRSTTHSLPILVSSATAVVVLQLADLACDQRLTGTGRAVQQHPAHCRQLQRRAHLCVYIYDGSRCIHSTTTYVRAHTHGTMAVLTMALPTTALPTMAVVVAVLTTALLAMALLTMATLTMAVVVAVLTMALLTMAAPRPARGAV